MMVLWAISHIVDIRKSKTKKYEERWRERERKRRGMQRIGTRWARQPGETARKRGLRLKDRWEKKNESVHRPEKGRKVWWSVGGESLRPENGKNPVWRAGVVEGNHCCCWVLCWVRGTLDSVPLVYKLQFEFCGLQLCEMIQQRIAWGILELNYIL